MHRLVQVATSVLLVSSVVAKIDALADDPPKSPVAAVGALERRAAVRAAERQTARDRWAYERRSAEAHARMPDTMYASTPSADVPPHAVPGIAAATSGVVDGKLAEDPLSVAQGAAAAENARDIPYFPSASDALGRQGFARVVNRSDGAGTITISAVDDAGFAPEALTLEIAANATVHFNSADLENGNAAKGLTGTAGPGQGGWRLVLSADFDFDAYAYIRTGDGFLTSMHDTAPEEDGMHRVVIFNPGSNLNQESRLRLVNAGDAPAAVEIAGTDDAGNASDGTVRVEIPAGESLTYTAAELETGGAPGLAGTLGDGRGKWRLAVESEGAVEVMSLLSSPTGHLTNLSTAPEGALDGTHAVPLFPSASDALGRQGFVRVVNHVDRTGEVTIRAYDGTDRAYEALTLLIGAGETKHFNSDDLEGGAPSKGLNGSTGAGEGDWRLELTSGLDIEVLSYIRTPDGFLTAVHDVAPVEHGLHRVATFNPGSNRNQASVLRLVNAGAVPARATVTGIDDRGASPGGPVTVTVPAGGSRTVTAAELESGGDGLEGALGDGSGKWRLEVESDRPITVMSLLSSPTAHLTNLSTAPGGGETVEEAYGSLISPIVQSKCVNCHVEGGASGNTRLVFTRGTGQNVRAANLQVLRDLLAEVEDGASYVLNKIQGVDHGGGIQVAAGSDEYADMERFLSLFGEDVGGGSAVTVDTLFDSVAMESWRSTLRRAAIVFAGRVPTEAEYASLEGGTGADLRAAIRGLMQGPEFHEFLLRGANDRLLTDRRTNEIVDSLRGLFVDYANIVYDLWESGIPAEERRHRESLYQYGFQRAPLELIAHVVEHDLPYTEVLTADYIMANPYAAKGYGASTKFDDPANVHEFRPSEIVSYYRDDDSKIVESHPVFGNKVIDPGNLITDYPHAGILNTTVFLLRYPTTATNRNRARSRWTYYHFLGLDIEKSASRTTDPVALADTSNPTMNNPACTVCHVVMDPVAGTFQNYGDAGSYRDQFGGLDSLDAQYKADVRSLQRTDVNGDTYESRETFSQILWLDPDSSLVIKHHHNNGCGDDGYQTCGRDLRIDEFYIGDLQGGVVDRVAWSELDEHCEYDGEYNEGTGSGDDHYRWWGWQCDEIPVQLAEAGRYVLKITVWADQSDGEVTRFEFGATGSKLYQEGDTWYRDMREPGFDGESVPDAGYSLPWLAERIVADPRFAEATVKFWWPAIMGTEVAEPPADGDADFEGRLLASNAQAAEVSRLARGFRRGFGGGAVYNLKDLLVEMVLSRWFRAYSMTDADPARATALANAGAQRLLTPEELARKTVALTGFDWGRDNAYAWNAPGTALNWTNTESSYGLLYGGIDSGGITKRGRELTSVMAGVAQRHAATVSCPVVMKDFYLLDNGDRHLFGGLTTATTPVSDFSAVREISASSRAEAETVSVSGDLTRGEATVTLAFVNNEQWFDDGDRNLRIDRVSVLDASGRVVAARELELSRNARGCEWNGPEEDHLAFYCEGSVDVAFDIPADGHYKIDAVAWADQYGDELAKLEILVGTDADRSAGGRAIKAKLAELHDAMLGGKTDASSMEIQAAFDLFVEVWEHGRTADNRDFQSVRCDFWDDSDYFDGILDDIWVTNEHGDPDRDWVTAHLDSISLSDRHHVARTWVVVLAYLMTDYRYLHL